MKIGDLVRARLSWVDDTTNEHHEWSDPLLIVDQYPIPDEELFIGLSNGQLLVVDEAAGLRDVEVLSEISYEMNYE